MAKLKFRERDDDIVTLKKFNQALNAHSLRVLLEASGIHAVVTGEEANSLIGLPMLPAGTLGAGVEVRVRRLDLETAELIMSEVPAASDVLIPAWACACGEDVDQGFAVCWSCGRDFDDSSPEYNSSAVASPEHDGPNEPQTLDELNSEQLKVNSSHGGQTRLLIFGVASFVAGFLLPPSVGILKFALVVAGACVGVFGLVKIAIARDNERAD